MSNLSYLEQYQTFDSKQELNYHVQQHEQAHIHELNATDRSILRFIARYSVKYSGASHLKVGTIAEGVGKSLRTVNYVLKRLEDNGIIKRISRMRRKSGGNGANIIQILPYNPELIAELVARREEAEEPTEPSEQADKTEKEPLHKHYSNNYILDTAKAIRNARIPVPLFDALSPFFGAKDIQRLVGVIFRAKTKKVRIEDYEEAYKACIYDCIRRYKNGVIQSLEGYLYTSIRRLSRRLFLEEELCV